MAESILKNHIKSYTNLSEEELTEVLSFFDCQSYKKKETLLPTSNRCDKLFFVAKGCLQLYFIDDLGHKKTTQFALESWWLTDFLAFQNQKRSNFTIEAVENSIILSISFSKYNELLSKFPLLEKYFRSIYETAYGAALMRLKYINSYSKEEMFFRFREDFPEFVQRVPQYSLASFLGLTPEYLSEIKRK
ncbi:Crp/Fnr family transcriptional regulator [Tenacibaculum larymnensis]|uniref:Crp/Fnr family transcriptional regulator n=1 Tax=Tenacibaculum larymnensis TaxID=2878201 RepID=A0A9X4IKS7_9FLAO|nr:Crp/Fnr family transcriptional regulator [Tenacibaculum larymnensis]MDE1205808.1 Crp/Fnr family transcriptional regulator [Tenacibaculum larymnensis]